MLRMKRDLSSRWIQRLACILKGLEKGLNALDPADIHYGRSEIRDGVVAMGETLLSCCLCGEIMAR